MNLPSFLEHDYKEMELTGNQFQKFHKLVHFNLKLLKYITILLYIDSSSSKFKTKKADKLIAINFQTPTEGQWLSLLELLLSIKSDHYKNKKTMLKTKMSDDLVGNFNRAYSSLINQSNYSQKEFCVFDIFSIT